MMSQNSYRCRPVDPLILTCRELRERGCVEVSNNGLELPRLNAEGEQVGVAGVIAAPAIGTSRFFNPQTGNVIEVGEHAVRSWHWHSGNPGSARVVTTPLYCEQLRADATFAP